MSKISNYSAYSRFKVKFIYTVYKYNNSLLPIQHSYVELQLYQTEDIP
jgi:hypothetical protein